MHALFQDTNDYIFVTAKNREELLEKIDSVHQLLDKNQIEVGQYTPD